MNFRTKTTTEFYYTFLSYEMFYKVALHKFQRIFESHIFLPRNVGCSGLVDVAFVKRF